MKKKQLDQSLSSRLAGLYKYMEEAYDGVARQLSFSCQGCPDNCCDSFFLHHTYIEWAYLWEGLNLFAEEKRLEVVARAAGYVKQSEADFARGERPQILCPLNEEGRCILYSHRMMICRMHGVPSSFMRPDGKGMEFPGCFRCQGLVADVEETPRVDRTRLYLELAALESEFLDHRRHVLPKVKKTLAQMIVFGPPQVPVMCGSD
ncbi:MAG: hypothetical protein KKE17_00950 [Proteobacteria bacterium]|nr:hypothetical protein [Pseudomonadota bacterium]MBU1708549.1 hypothetical protein [Pseudomonadota bacterium]